MQSVSSDHISAERSRSVPFAQFYRRFFGDTKGWFRLIEETEVVASGSAVLNLLMPGLPGSSTMELFAGKTKLSSTGVSRWRSFLEEAGYRLDRVDEARDGSSSFFFEKLDSTVVFVVTDCEPVGYIFSRACSTHLMNVLTLDGLYCPFSRMTLKYRKMVILRELGDFEEEMVSSFVASGFSKVHLVVGSMDPELQGWRSLADGEATVFRPLLGERLYGERYKQWLERLRSARFCIRFGGVKVECAHVA
jgi:hypothetical protein